MSWFSNIGNQLLGGLTGGMAGGLPGVLMGALGLGGGNNDPYQRNRTLLRGLSSGERGAMDGSLAILGQSPDMYERGIFDSLFNPMSDDIKRTFSREKGKTDFMFKSTGGGPSSVRNQAARNLAGEEGRALASGRASAAGAASSIGNARRASALGTYSSILGGRNIGATTETSFPGDNFNSMLSLGMDASLNKDSWLNKGGSDWLARLFGGGGGGGAGGGAGKWNMFTGNMPTLPAVDPRLLRSAIKN